MGVDASAVRLPGYDNPTLWLVLLGYAWVAGTWHSFTPQATVLTFLPGLAAGAVILPARRDPVALDTSTAGWVVWVLLVAALGGWEAWAFVTGSTHAHPTMSTLVNSWMHGRYRRRVAFFGWLTLGGWLHGLRR